MDGNKSSIGFWKIDTAAQPKTAAFAGFFQIVAIKDEAAPLPHHDIVAEINNNMMWLDGIIPPQDSDRASRVNKIRDDFASELRRLADDIIENRIGSAVQFSTRLGEARGVFKFRWGELMTFRPIAELSPDPPALASSLRFLPLRDATAEQQVLLVDIIRATTVVDVVLERRSRGPNWFVRAYAYIRGNEATLPEPKVSAQAEKLRSVYLRQLKDIVDEGLSSPAGALYAQRRLEVFRDAFVAREADVVKNHHVRRLGLWSLGFAAPLLILAYFTDHTTPLTTVRIVDHEGLKRNFLLLAAAACAGTWMSFSLRRVVLGFSDLAALEDDRLNPAGRLMFVILLTCVLALLIQTKIVNIMIGETSITAGGTGLMAIVLGALCGIGERSLSGAVARKAEDVVGAAARSNTPGAGGRDA